MVSTSASFSPERGWPRPIPVSSTMKNFAPFASGARPNASASTAASRAMRCRSSLPFRHRVETILSFSAGVHGYPPARRSASTAAS
jgi:hypothetical protein